MVNVGWFPLASEESLDEMTNELLGKSEKALTRLRKRILAREARLEREERQEFCVDFIEYAMQDA